MFIEVFSVRGFNLYKFPNELISKSTIVLLFKIIQATVYHLYIFILDFLYIFIVPFIRDLKGGLPMNRQQADRIIVKSNARMQLVLDWYYENKDWLDKAEFHASMESGVIELLEEEIEVMFENKGNIVEISVFPGIRSNLPPVVVFDYNPHTWTASNYRIAPHLPKERQNILKLVMQFDNTDKKEAVKYHTLTLFMTYKDASKRQRHGFISGRSTMSETGVEFHPALPCSEEDVLRALGE